MLSICLFTFDDEAAFRAWTLKDLATKLGDFRTACDAAMDPDRLRITSRMVVGPEYLFCSNRWLRYGWQIQDLPWQQTLDLFPGSLRAGAYVVRSNAYSRRSRLRYEQAMLALSLAYPGTLVMPGTILWAHEFGNFGELVNQLGQHRRTRDRINPFYETENARLLSPTGNNINYHNPSDYLDQQFQNPATHVTRVVRNTSISWWQGERVHQYDKILDSGEAIGSANAMFLSGDYGSMQWTLNGKRIRQYICMDHHLVAEDPLHGVANSDLTVFMSGSEAEQAGDYPGVDAGGVFVHADTRRDRCHVRRRLPNGNLGAIAPEDNILNSGLRVLRYRVSFDLTGLPTTGVSGLAEAPF